jgi:predicted regulator of Ras-like GTPase activity (Roadblock/LC7/MglB family)
MSEAATELDEDEIVEAVAAALGRLGLAASSQDTGGGISCVVLEHKDGGEISWGTADETWGATITDADGKYVSSIETTCPSDSQDIAAIAAALLGASIKNGAVLSRS